MCKGAHHYLPSSTATTANFAVSCCRLPNVCHRCWLWKYIHSVSDYLLSSMSSWYYCNSHYSTAHDRHSRCFVSVIVVIHICCSRGWSSSSLVVIVVVACHGCCLPSPLLPTTTQSLSSLPMHTNMTATTLLPVIFQPSILALLTIFINRLSAILHNNISSTKELFIPGLTHFTYIVSPVGTGSDFTSTRCVCLTRTLNNTSASPVAEYYMCLFLYQLFENSVHPGS